MFNNPIFDYAGFNNPLGSDPYIVSLVNTNDFEEEISLFNAQENLTAENLGLPKGVVSNAEWIFEMPTEQTFTCFEPLVGFNTNTDFFLEDENGNVLRQFRVLSTIDSFKAIVEAFDGVENATLYRFDTIPPRILLNATADFADAPFIQDARFVFFVTSLQEATKGLQLVELRVANSTTYPCLDRFALTATQTGFNNNDSTNASSYAEILQTSNFAPFGVDSLVLQSPKITALAENPFYVTEKDANGNREQQQVTLLRSPYMRPNQRVISNLRKIDGATEISFTLPKSTSATLFIYDKYRMMP